MTESSKHVLLTGPPGCGKTTVVQRLVEHLADLRLAGFYTRELREGGRRVGFEAVGLRGRVVPLAHVKSRSPHRVGKYGVELEEFESLVQDELYRPSGSTNVLLVDEIGKMECFSRVFVDAVRQILEGDVPLVATIAQRGSGFIAEVKNGADVELQTVTRSNRDALPGELAQTLGH